ncbi:hypothetical protein [Blastococcus sp. TF02A-35]|uniref:hypothetical protein n=1 Tax=Blastococcus sp. TF02A-35 TaxID=2559612 RepID=UPI001073DEE9|nr:hypothetical protein [Blastococcus sp. TF02A_35]TFV53407.1 hypothetical protein E4P43_02400 [Blastococcus sp. TF02A_35]
MTAAVAATLIGVVVAVASIVVGSILAWLNLRQSRAAQTAKEPQPVAEIGLSARGVRMFTPITDQRHFDEGAMAGHSGHLGVRVRNRGERAFEVTTVVCYAAHVGMSPPSKGGAWPDGPDVPHVIGTNEAIWDMSLEEVSRLLNFGQARERVCDASFEVSLATGQVLVVGPVRLHFPTEE